MGVLPPSLDKRLSMTIQTLAQDFASSHSDDIDLDSLLADSVQQVQDAQKLSKGKAKLASGWIGTAEKADLKRDLDAISARREWTSTAAVCLFREQTCLTCGNTHSHFQGLFIEQAHRNGNTKSWERTVDNISMQALPRQRKIDKETCDMCEFCAHTVGWPA